MTRATSPSTPSSSTSATRKLFLGGDSRPSVPLTFSDRSLSHRSYGDDNRQTPKPPPEAVHAQAQTAVRHFEHLKLEGVKAGDQMVLVSGGAWTAEGGLLRPGLLALWQHLVDYGVQAIIADDLCAAPSLHPVSALELDHALTLHPDRSPRRIYPSQGDGGLAFTLGLERVLVNGFEVAVDPAALADMEHAEEAARAHAAAMASAGGKCTVASHGAQMANGGIATMSGEHAPGIQSAGGTAGLGKKRGIYKKPHQTAAQAARAAEKKRARYRAAASRAAGAH